MVPSVLRYLMIHFLFIGTYLPTYLIKNLILLVIGVFVGCNIYIPTVKMIENLQMAWDNGKYLSHYLGN